MKLESSIITEPIYNQFTDNNCIDEIIIDPKNKQELKYDYSKKILLVRKINKIKKKDYLIKILQKIIMEFLFSFII